MDPSSNRVCPVCRLRLTAHQAVMGSAVCADAIPKSAATYKDCARRDGPGKFCSRGTPCTCGWLNPDHTDPEDAIPNSAAARDLDCYQRGPAWRAATRETEIEHARDLAVDSAMRAMWIGGASYLLNPDSADAAIRLRGMAIYNGGWDR